MRIVLHIGPETTGADRIQSILSDKREGLKSQGVLFARSPGNRNHMRLYMAVTDPDHVDPFRYNRGYAAPEAQAVLRDAMIEGLRAEIAATRPDTLILSAAQMASSIHRPSEVARLRDLLAPLSDDIQVVATVSDPARMLLDHYAAQVSEGRAAPLEQELELIGAPGWWRAAIAAMPDIDPIRGMFEETQGPAFWLDLVGLVALWEEGFGTGAVRLFSHDPADLASPGATELVREMFGITRGIGRAEPTLATPLPSAAALSRQRRFNELLLRYMANGDKVVTRQLWRSLLDELAIDGPPPAPDGLAAISARFEAANSALMLDHPGLNEEQFTPPPAADWVEADPERGFRASQYLLAARWRIEKLSAEQLATRAEQVTGETAGTTAAIAPQVEAENDNSLSETARRLMPPLAVQNFEKLRKSSYAPHNRIGAVDEEQLAAAFSPAKPRKLAKGRTGNIIVGCMKNEAPYIVEWVAYHRAIGVDNFLIYTNDCSDGTSEILDRLQELGVLQHRNNDKWKGNSPQQHALNQALKEPVLKNSDWIIHIDVDEFINIRCGNGTLDDFFAAAPEATNVAMTWRLFGHNGVTELKDGFVIDQFDACAPKYCPKPHTVWGFKTMFRNIGAYEKISCHRPNKLDEAFEAQVKWVNGSGQDMTGEALKSGWRNSKKSIGYDLLQLNHYALRSAESFLVKRQRGRALHVDRSIGLNYWIRMDWNDHRDVTIKRNLPRMRAEYERLMQDDTLRDLHAAGLDWHRAKAAELHGMPEFEDLYKQALEVQLTGTERVAYALALDMES
ncbi:glycosyltransferase family 2 protein [Ruegeria pomeroyi]|nr:glycosyltransferase family 2 protein [Ruegeria pomeroyi]